MNKLLTGLVLMTFLACRENSTREEKREEVKAGLEKIQQDLKETADAAAGYLSEQKEKVANDLEERRREIDQKIEALRDDSTGRAVQARRKLTGLRNDINRKLEDLKGASAATWDSTQLKIDTLLKKSDKEWTAFKKGL